MISGAMPVPVSADLDQHVFADRHALVAEARALLGADIGGAQA